MISDAFSFQEWRPGKGDQSEEKRDEICDGFLNYPSEVEEKLLFSKSSHCESC